VTPLVGVLAAYLVGAIPIGFLVARAFGVTDIRRHGSGNIGATNVARALGHRAAALTLLGDVGKGYAAVVVGSALVAGDPGAAAACAVAAVIGNCWSVFLRFHGGKGVATGLGALLRLVPWAVAPAALVWLAVVLTVRYVSLGSVMAAACVPLGALLLGYDTARVAAAFAVAGIVVVRHRANIARLLAGREPRIGQRVRTG
jgi:glycerol-3-phosphate acyltransferase PlsY